MALVTVQRSPSSSNSSSTISVSETDDEPDNILKKSCSSFFAVKGAALFLPRGTDHRPIKKNPVVGDLQVHLQSMFVLLRPQDSITLAVRLESIQETHIRYLALVSCIGVEDTEENIILGVDFVQKNATIGLILPVWAETEINLNGDGGFTLKTKNRLHIFKPVSVQALWSALQALNKACEMARKFTYYSGGLNLTWTSYYEPRVLSKHECIKEWNMLPDIESHQSVEHRIQRDGDLIKPSVRELTERLIVVKLREVLLNVDIEETTSKEIRTKLEEVVGNELREFKGFIDEQMLIILRQMDSASQIFDFLYLGSEWNAGNLTELEQNGVGYILNVTKEIDNFFPGRFKYFNVRLYDVESSDLLRHWEDTHRFLAKAKEAGSKAMVHCKMGISRSAATVIAFAMKENRWSLERALKYVKEKRKVINPNRGFRLQLEEYQGILDASDQRHNQLWRSKSESSLSTTSSAESHVHVTDINLSDPVDLQPTISEELPPSIDPRRRSWSPNDATSEALLGPSHEDLEVSRSAISSPMYLDSPTAANAGAGFVIGDGGSDSDNDAEKCCEIKIVVPEVATVLTEPEINQFPPPGYVSQKIISIEGVTTGESMEESQKAIADEKSEEPKLDTVMTTALDPEVGTVMIAAENQEIAAKDLEIDMPAAENLAIGTVKITTVDPKIAMIAAEDPGKFIIEGAITGESTEENVMEVGKEGHKFETRQPHVETKVECDNDEIMPLEGATAAPEQVCDMEEGKRTLINYPINLPLAESKYMFPPDVDLESITSSTVVTVDEDDDYMKTANFEDDTLEEEGNLEDSAGSTPEVQMGSSDSDRLASPDEKDELVTPEDTNLPVLQVPEPQDENSSLHAQNNVYLMKNEEEGDTNVSDMLPTGEELHLDIVEGAPLELNTNNNSSNENSSQNAAITISSVAKDLAQPIEKTSISLLERQNVSLHSTMSPSPDSPESDGIKTASSETSETPNASLITSAKDYPMGSVRSRARSYETQFSTESEEHLVVNENYKSEVAFMQLNAEETQDKKSIPCTTVSVNRQKKDIEERLISEFKSENSPPIVRAAKFFQDNSSSDASKPYSKPGLSPPSSTAPEGEAFASPSLQSLEKGIVKKLTKQLLLNKTTVTKDFSETNTVEATEPLLDNSIAHSNTNDNSTVATNTNPDESQANNVINVTDDKEKFVRPSSASEALLEQTKQDFETTEVSSTELVSAEESSTVVLRKHEPKTYSKFGDEKIPLEPGIVKRHTKDYEQMSLEMLKEEIEMMEKASASEPDDESPAVASSESPDVTVQVEADAQCAYPEEGSLWCVGDVRRHKQVYEDMKDADSTELLECCKPSTVKMSQASWETKLTAEELENIKELGKIVLGRDDDLCKESDKEDDNEEEMAIEEGEPSKADSKDEGKFIAVNERIRKLEMKIDKPKGIHIDLKRASSIARMSSEKMSPTSARRRYERRKVIIRSKSNIANKPSTTNASAEEASPVNKTPTIKEIDGESSKGDHSNKYPNGRATATKPQEIKTSLQKRLKSKSEGEEHKEPLHASYKETFEESTQDAVIQEVLNQAHLALLQKPPPQPRNENAQGVNLVQSGDLAHGSSQKRKRNHGNSHPLTKLTAHARTHPFYNTM